MRCLKTVRLMRTTSLAFGKRERSSSRIGGTSPSVNRKGAHPFSSETKERLTNARSSSILMKVPFFYIFVFFCFADDDLSALLLIPFLLFTSLSRGALRRGSSSSLLVQGPRMPSAEKHSDWLFPMIYSSQTRRNHHAVTSRDQQALVAARHTYRSDPASNADAFPRDRTLARWRANHLATNVHPLQQSSARDIMQVLLSFNVSSLFLLI